MSEGSATALATFLTNTSSIITAATGWMKDIIAIVVETPILLVPAVLGIAFIGIRMFKALR